MTISSEQKAVSGKNERSETMIRRINVCFLLTVLLFAVSPSAAQEPDKISKIGFLAVVSLSTLTPRTEALRQGLRDLGYVEGKNVFIEWRSAEGNPDRMPTLVAELVHLKVDVIVTAGSTATRFAKAATVTIPIVMAQDGDPVANGFVASLARPGGNITGLSTLSPELSGKRLELLKEIIPKLSRVAVFATSTNAEDAKALEEIKLAAGAMKLQLQYLDVLTAKDVDPGFRAATKARANAVLWTVSGSVTRAYRTQVVELAIKNRLPTIYSSAEWVEAGGLMTYGVSYADMYRRAAMYVDKILKGAKPADLPVEQPTKFEFIINLKTAKQIGLTIPPNVLVRADKVIK
jgi:putative ABC transport system substrate-binding protein